MAKTQFTDSAGRTAWRDSSGMVYTTGGSTATNYNVNDWNKRQLDKYGSSSSSSNKSSSSSSSSNNMQSTIENAIKMQQKAAQPAIDQLKSTIPSTQASFDTRASQLEAEKQPLQARYQSLIDSIKGNQVVAENRQTVTSRNELGKRGIPLTSGVAEQEVTNAVNPITSEYTGLIKDTGLAQEADLRTLANDITNLGLSKVDAVNAISNAIAQMQSGASSAGITTGLGIYESNLSQQNLEQQRALAEKIYAETTLPESQASIANTNSLIAERNSNSSSGSNLTNFLNSWNKNSTSGAGKYYSPINGYQQNASIDSFLYN